MPPTDLRRFAENRDRALFLTADVTDETVTGMAAEIVRLKQASNEPICLYIDSAGGSVFYAQRLLSFLTSPRQDGHAPWIITICIGFAGSAAADLLALGDYAMAYPFSLIHHHGTRQSEKELTVESIGRIESRLRETNEDFAIRLATKIFHRLIVRILQIRGEQSPDFLFHETIADPQTFITSLRDKLSERHRQIITDAANRQKDVAQVLKIAGIKPEETQQPPESQLLKAVIDYESNKAGGQEKAFLSASDLSAIRDNFYQIRGLYHERYWINLIDIVHRKGEHFLLPDESDQFKKIPHDKPIERSEFLVQRVAHKLNPIWWFVVSLSRCLQSGEHTISPVDAYWLGLIDEVVGSGLPSLRLFASQQQQAAVAQQQPNTSTASAQAPQAPAAETPPVVTDHEPVGEEP
ncbi:MAG TPA: ATP-dependent Clp protease proteolytic subunit, partial [Chthoniobacterales bacterium]|nr:ATP-dependent Clp protease proteolytic subunit [Chthoniobacterales bacterium]